MTGFPPDRAPLRARLLDAAHRLVEANGWHRLRVSHVAAAAGVSRQSAYNEFGAKDALGEALVLREFERHLEALKESLLDHRDDPEAAVRDAVLSTFERTGDSALLTGILTSARVGWGTEELVEIFRNRSVPLMPLAVAAVADLVGKHRPDLDRTSVELATDMVFRVTISYIVTPDGDPEAAAERIARMAGRVLLPGMR